MTFNSQLFLIDQVIQISKIIGQRFCHSFISCMFICMLGVQNCYINQNIGHNYHLSATKMTRSVLGDIFTIIFLNKPLPKSP